MLIENFAWAFCITLLWWIIAHGWEILWAMFHGPGVPMPRHDFEAWVGVMHTQLEDLKAMLDKERSS